MTEVRLVSVDAEYLQRLEQALAKTIKFCCWMFEDHRDNYGTKMRQPEETCRCDWCKDWRAARSELQAILK